MEMEESRFQNTVFLLVVLGEPTAAPGDKNVATQLRTDPLSQYFIENNNVKHLNTETKTVRIFKLLSFVLMHYKFDLQRMNSHGIKVEQTLPL
jgi:hypothetical protein